MAFATSLLLGLLCLGPAIIFTAPVALVSLALRRPARVHLPYLLDVVLVSVGTVYDMWAGLHGVVGVCGCTMAMRNLSTSSVPHACCRVPPGGVALGFQARGNHKIERAQAYRAPGRCPDL